MNFNGIPVLIGYERSGAIRRRFRARGFAAFSCDIHPADDGSPFHFTGPVQNYFDAFKWAFAIFHPECTYLTGACAWAFSDPDFDRYPGGGYHQKLKPGTLTGAARRAARDASVAEVRELLDLPFPKVVENPVGFLSKAIRPADQIIQPNQFGDDASKKTCLWMDEEVPLLKPTKLIAPRMVDGKPRWGNQTDSGQNKLSPGDDRAQKRSETFPGIADACAAQWGAWLVERYRRAA